MQQAFDLRSRCVDPMWTLSLEVIHDWCGEISFSFLFLSSPSHTHAHILSWHFTFSLSLSPSQGLWWIWVVLLLLHNFIGFYITAKLTWQMQPHSCKGNSSPIPLSSKSGQSSTHKKSFLSSKKYSICLERMLQSK